MTNKPSLPCQVQPFYFSCCISRFRSHFHVECTQFSINSLVFKNMSDRLFWNTVRVWWVLNWQNKNYNNCSITPFARIKQLLVVKPTLRWVTKWHFAGEAFNSIGAYILWLIFHRDKPASCSCHTDRVQHTERRKCPRQ